MPAFKAAVGRIDALLDRVQLAYRTLAFTRDGDSWALQFDDRVFADLTRTRGDSGLLVGLFAAGTVGTERVDRWMRAAVVSSTERIPDLKRARSLGLGRTAIDVDPETGIMPPSGVLMYSLDGWAEIVSASSSRTLRIEGNSGDLSHAIHPTAIVVFVPTDG